MFKLRDGTRDYYLVEGETNDMHKLCMNPYGRFVSEFLVPMGLTVDKWATLKESGNRLNARALGNNDLSFVDFGKKPRFGVLLKETEWGLVVQSVSEDSPASRAGLQMGDVLHTVDGKQIQKIADLGRFTAALVGKERVDIEYYRAGRKIQRPTLFLTSKTALESGALGHLGLTDPESLVSPLLQEQERIGGLLSRDLTARCSACSEREQRAVLAEPLGVTDFVRLALPFAGALIGLDAAMKWTVLETAQRAELFISMTSQILEMTREIEDLSHFLQEQVQVGAPMLVDPTTIEIDGGDSFSVEGGPGAGKYRLAYLAGEDSAAEEYLGGVVAASVSTKGVVVLVPDGADTSGRTHVHVLVMRRDSGEHGLAGLRLECYLNLSMVSEGVAKVRDHRAGDGRSTLFVLKALRKVESVSR